MTRSRKVWAFGLVAALVAVGVACTGDDPELIVRDPQDSAASVDGSSGDGGDAAIVLPLTVERIASISVGSVAACVITSDDKALWCIGRVEEGEALRQPNTTNDHDHDVQCVGTNASLWRGSPRFEHIAIGPVDKVAVGLRSRCAIQAGKILCWGGNRSGELGHAPGTANDVECGASLMCNLTPQEPVSLPAGASFVDIVAGNRAFCARTAEGAVYCWGDNMQSQTARPISPTELPHKVELFSGGAATAIAMGLTTACVAITNPMGATCWGSNANQAVSANPDAGTDPISVPQFIPATTGTAVRALDINDQGGCVLSQSGASPPTCWGNNVHGLVAANTAIPSGAFDLGVGEFGAIVRIGTTAWTWGEGRRGGLATGSITDGGAADGGGGIEAPAMRPLLDGVRLIAFGFEENGMALRGNKLLAWGSNSCGQLGHAPATEGDDVCERGEPCRSTPVEISLP